MFLHKFMASSFFVAPSLVCIQIINYGSQPVQVVSDLYAANITTARLNFNYIQPFRKSLNKDV